jgi:hypothetical protein
MFLDSGQAQAVAETAYAAVIFVKFLTEQEDYKVGYYDEIS